VQVSASDFDLAGLPPPPADDVPRRGTTRSALVAEGYDLRALRGDAAPRLRAQLASARPASSAAG